MLKESLRYRSPVSGTARELKSDVEIMGYHIPKDTYAFVSTHTPTNDGS